MLLEYRRLNNLIAKNVVWLGIGYITRGVFPSINGGMMDNVKTITEITPEDVSWCLAEGKSIRG